MPATSNQRRTAERLVTHIKRHTTKPFAIVVDEGGGVSVSSDLDFHASITTARGMLNVAASAIDPATKCKGCQQERERILSAIALLDTDAHQSSTDIH